MRRTLLILALGLASCNEYGLKGDRLPDRGGDDDTGDDGPDSDTTGSGLCDVTDYPAEERGIDDVCVPDPPGGFTPIVEWSNASGKGCMSQPIVADLDQDGVPEVIYNELPNFFAQRGYLTVLDGATGVPEWQLTTTQVAYGSPPAVGDIDGDGSADIVVVQEYQSSLFAAGDYTVAAFDATGVLLWESDHFTGADFDWATAPNLRDMDADGLVEVIAGRAILHGLDGSTRGVGEHGRGSYGISGAGSFSISEASVSAVTDLDLDGVDEVIVGNAMYDADGQTLWYDPAAEDAMISVANLDADPEGEFVAVTFNTIRAVDTDGTVLWGPTELPTGNILATAAIADLDEDGSPEIVTAGGNELVVFHADGTEYWRSAVQDESGASGASFFDFEGDGVLEIVYIDEVRMIVFDGQTGAEKFSSSQHGSGTMFDYPTVADVDADDQAEIIVCHNNFGPAISAYGDQDESWRPARDLWNQHAYDIDNIEDDLSVPAGATPGFSRHNTWHSAIPGALTELGHDLSAEILEVCTDECEQGSMSLVFRVVNTAPADQVDPVWLTLYAEFDGVVERVQSTQYAGGVPAGWTTEGVLMVVDAADVAGATSLQLVVDDDGSGAGEIEECSEDNNLAAYGEELCPAE